PNGRIGMPVAETNGTATAPSAAVPIKSRREILIPERLSRLTDQVEQRIVGRGASRECPGTVPGTGFSTYARENRKRSPNYGRRLTKTRSRVHFRPSRPGGRLARPASRHGTEVTR